MRRLLPLLLATLLLPACSSPSLPRRDPAGETFPAVRGESLDGTEVELPAHLAGEPAVLLVGYVMEAHFDLDRWLLGLLQAETPARVLEVPTSSRRCAVSSLRAAASS